MEDQNQDNQTPTPPVSPVAQTQPQTPPVQTPPVPNPINPPVGGPKSKLPILIIGIILFLLIAGSAAGFYVFKQQSLKTAAKPTPAPIVQKQTPTLTPKPVDWKKTCRNDFEEKIFFQRNGNEVILKDTINNYQINLTNFPDAQFSEGTSCSNSNYQLEMYRLRLGSKNVLYSVTRVNFYSQALPEKTSSLETFAINNLDYVQGIHVEENNNYGNPINSLPLIPSLLPSGIKELSWIDKYSPEPKYVEGGIANKWYLLLIDGKVYTFQLTSWDIPAFNNAVKDFDRVIQTFKFTNNQTTDTSSWKTFDSQKFSFKYPAGWNKDEYDLHMINLSSSDFEQGGGIPSVTKGVYLTGDILDQPLIKPYNYNMSCNIQNSTSINVLENQTFLEDMDCVGHFTGPAIGIRQITNRKSEGYLVLQYPQEKRIDTNFINQNKELLLKIAKTFSFKP